MDRPDLRTKSAPSTQLARQNGWQCDCLQCYQRELSLIATRPLYKRPAEFFGIQDFGLYFENPFGGKTAVGKRPRVDRSATLLHNDSEKMDIGQLGLRSQYLERRNGGD